MNKDVIEREVHIANKHMKIYSTSLGMRKFKL